MLNANETKIFKVVELKAPGIIERTSVREPVITGILAIDAIIHIGQKILSIIQIITGVLLTTHDAIRYITIVAATALDSTILQFLVRYNVYLLTVCNNKSYASTK